MEPTNPLVLQVHQCACITLTFHQWTSECAQPAHSLDQQGRRLGKSLSMPDGRWREFLWICFLIRIKAFCTKKLKTFNQKTYQQKSGPNQVTCQRFIGSETPHDPKHTYTLHSITPLNDQGYDWVSGQSSLLCDRSNLVTMAAGISGDGLQRVGGISRGLRNNKKKAVTVTFELGVMGLAQQFEAWGVRKWAGVTHNPGGQRISSRSWQDLQRTQWVQ